ncbi:5-carboxymethyl-2-hydroxymuconate Delta-isomerase [Fluoribacter dumoffii]|uniref:5-carboxymethyl-2-hydroxymuconate Delta-isomerase n=1 Tax=Fluoribacter dumoffii TaxID=463 RepID=A0A377G753_9GAMM|nr:5-carboxymethyl-2-hydroxymuconate Delta-isomerase [Fluoribacter dumoffii]KTC89546.1 5-carboxymethyl-2-hydroxymuconate Delta-isomerase [Fluoribacter dumoffii NY 23]MCW8384740.1 5-carboxymethyl-2-hydroxymuconate Delta-isomerase [Fluoribacter dumoffii]MCW8417803.1 5-carboxymethyl-2-hydroxymuconate Delta-isomerase [Fluoribacter dumoffii]MCW8454355.1 5-carboxymethyl-2-hydroxymuconate Delta-isomerase [Fluoribacter dumoffii]MCW8461571.1 5-carboxymethyl-2-hydroxymuconate Delta-isomerase [Fluoribact
MPHLLLELSNNIKNTEHLNQLFTQLHQVLSENLPTPLSNCRSRCIVHPMFFIGDQSEYHAFVHLTLKILAGRDEAKKRSIGQKLFDLLDKFFRTDPSGLNITLSVEIRDLDPVYFKG